MSNNPRSRMSRLKLVAVPLLLASLAACAQPFNARVSRFQSQLPAPQGQTFTIVADNPALAGGLEFSQYAGLVADRMAALGYSPVNNPGTANLIVHFDYGVDKGRERIQSTGFGRDPFYSPWFGYGRGFGRGGYYGGGHYGGGFGRSGYYPRGGFGSSWGYGWHDPFFDNGIESYTVYTSGIDLKIDERGGRRLFEGKAEAVSTSNRLQYVVPNLVEAMFTGFPGNSGETVRISVAPEKRRN